MRCPLDIENRKVCGEALYFGAGGSGELEKEKMSMREEGKKGGGGFSLFSCSLLLQRT